MRYHDCQSADGDCSACSLSNYDKDCHNAPVNHIAYLRTKAGLTQKRLADAAGVHIRLVQKLEGEEASPKNITLKNAVALAKALGVSAEDLLRG